MATTTDALLTSWVAWMRAARIAPGTIYLRTRHLHQVFRELPVGPLEVTTDHLVEFIAAQAWVPNTARSYRATMRSFWAWLQARGHRPDNPAWEIPAIRCGRQLPKPTPESIYLQGLAAADRDVRLMIQLAAVGGLRRMEIAKVRRDHVVRDLTGWSLEVLGKGGHVRMVPLPDEMAREILARPAGWLFPSSRRPGPLSRDHVGKVVSQAFPRGWSCHNLRHRCGSIAYQSSKDLRAVQELLGHAHVSTTEIYTAVGNTGVRDAMMAAAAATSWPAA